MKFEEWKEIALKLNAGDIVERKVMGSSIVHKCEIYYVKVFPLGGISVMTDRGYLHEDNFVSIIMEEER